MTLRIHCRVLILLSVASHTLVLGFFILPHLFSGTGNVVTRPYFSSSARATNTQLGLALGGGGATDVALRLAQQVQPSVALVLPKGVRNMTARGSGFIVDFNNATAVRTISEDEEDVTYLITAAHVASPGHDIQISLGGGINGSNNATRQSASVVARNFTLDLALLQTKRILPARGLRLAEELPEVGTFAFAHGYPASRLRGPVMTSGIVCGIADGLGVPTDGETDDDEENNNDDDSIIFVVTDAAMSGGMSGGPLVNASGFVVGVNALIRPDLRALGNYAVSTQEVLAFLADCRAILGGEIPHASGYRVWLFNDPMNKRERVSKVLKEVASLNETTANQVMWQAHTSGRCVVANVTDGSQAELLCQALRKQDLLVEVEPISSS